MDATFDHLAQQCERLRPEFGLVLGSGLGALIDRMDVDCRVPFSAIVGLPAASIHGHKGCITLASWAKCRMLVCEGRLHYYEGNPWEVITRPVEILADLGVKTLLLTNAAGGIRSDLGSGSLMLVTDHFQWNRPFPWRVPGPGGLAGPRPSPYSLELVEALHVAARNRGITLHEGIYAAMPGPSYETPAEIRALAICSAAAVGMSTTREVESAVARGMKCAVVSSITNQAAGLSHLRLDHRDVLQMGARMAWQLGDLLEEFFRNQAGTT